MAVTRNGTPGRATFEVCDAEVRFTGPASVAALFRDALDAFAPPGEPPWSALERLLHHVIGYWEATPRHRDPNLRARRLARRGSGVQRATQPAGPPSPLPIARGRHRAREPRDGLRLTSPARNPHRRHPRLRCRAEQRPMAARREIARAPAAHVRRRPALPGCVSTAYRMRGVHETIDKGPRDRSTARMQWARSKGRACQRGACGTRFRMPRSLRGLPSSSL